MDLDSVFPEDPLEPTVKYIGVNQTPFSVPWAKGKIQLCAGFNTKRSQEDDLFMKSMAFRDTWKIPLKYRQCQITSIKDESSSSIASTSGNTSFAISASVGGSFLGASGRGSYEKNARENRNMSNISVRADHMCGQIDLIHHPQLADDAVRLLKKSSDPINEFRKIYGDFYVAGYRVGAVNSTTVYGELANTTFFEAKLAELKIKVALLKKHKSINEVSRSANDVGLLRVAAFDSLADLSSDFTALTYEDSIRASQIASENKQRAMDIATRAAELLRKDFSLGMDGIVYQDAVDRLCDRGLVTELLLAPFTAIREYRSLLSRRSSRR